MLREVIQSYARGCVRHRYKWLIFEENRSNWGWILLLAPRFTTTSGSIRIPVLNSSYPLQPHHCSRLLSSYKVSFGSYLCLTASTTPVTTMTSLTEKPPISQPATPYNDLLFDSTHDDESSSKNYTLDKKTEGGSQQLLMDTPPPLSEEEIKALYRKLDFRCVSCSTSSSVDPKSSCEGWCRFWPYFTSALNSIEET